MYTIWYAWHIIPYFTRWAPWHSLISKFLCPSAHLNLALIWHTFFLSAGDRNVLFWPGCSFETRCSFENWCTNGEIRHTLQGVCTITNFYPLSIQIMYCKDSTAIIIHIQHLAYNCRYHWSYLLFKCLGDPIYDRVMLDGTKALTMLSNLVIHSYAI